MTQLLQTRGPRIAALLVLLTIFAAALACTDHQQQSSNPQPQNPQSQTAAAQPSTVTAPKSSNTAGQENTPPAETPNAPKAREVAAKTSLSAANISPEKLAKCLSAKGVKMYGDFRCPHCARQKALFGDAVKYLPYVECGTPGKPMAGPFQQGVCRDLQITKYPTWVFPDGERVASEQTLEALAERSGCKVE